MNKKQKQKLINDEWETLRTELARAEKEFGKTEKELKKVRTSAWRACDKRLKEIDKMK